MLGDDAAHLVDVPLDERRDQRLLAREVLVERADADAGGVGDAVGAGAVVAFLDEDASSRREDDLDRLLRAGLNGIFPRRGARSGHGVPRCFECE